MKQLVAAVSRKLPRELKNFHLIKRQSIFIPYCEIGITCLTKEVTEINLFFETILKLIDIEVADVYEISAIMGVEFKLLKEAIVDMIEQKYIITSQNKLIMTPRGRKALADRKQVTIRKRNINELSVNMITGNIEESGKNAFAKPSKRDICLSEEQTITKDYLESNYAIINEIYQRNQIESNIFNTKILQRELYKILDIAYEKLYYVKDELFIYKMMIQKIMSLLLKVTLEKDTRIAFIIKYETWYIQGWKTFLKEIGIFRKITMIKGLSLRKIGNIQRV